MMEPLHGSGKVVTSDSGICVMKGVMALHKKGVFFQSLIKKCWYWPAQVPGDQIDAFMMMKRPVETHTFVQDLEGVHFYVHCSHDSNNISNVDQSTFFGPSICYTNVQWFLS